MPGVELTIEPGTILEFYLSVGILVLGTLEAQGTIDRSIVMRPVRKSDIKDYRIAQRMGFASNTKYKDVGHPAGKPRVKRRLLLEEEDEDFDVRYEDAFFSVHTFSHSKCVLGRMTINTKGKM